MAWVPLAAAAISAAGDASKGGPAGPSGVASDPMASLGLSSDFSNWTVALGGSKATAENVKADEIPVWLKAGALVLAAIVAVRWIKSAKKA